MKTQQNAVPVLKLVGRGAYTLEFATKYGSKKCQIVQKYCIFVKFIRFHKSYETKLVDDVVRNIVLPSC